MPPADWRLSVQVGVGVGVGRFESEPQAALVATCYHSCHELIGAACSSLVPLCSCFEPAAVAAVSEGSGGASTAAPPQLHRSLAALLLNRCLLALPSSTATHRYTAAFATGYYSAHALLSSSITPTYLFFEYSSQRLGVAGALGAASTACC